MANLTECRECGHTISKTARSCPSCGSRKATTFYQRHPIFSWIFLIFIVLPFTAIFLLATFQTSNYKPADPIPAKVLTKEETEEKLKQEAIADKKRDMERRFRANTRQLVKITLKNLRDPRSAEIVGSATKIRENEKEDVTCLIIRSRNGFGGMALTGAVMFGDTYSFDETTVEKYCKNVSIETGFQTTTAISKETLETEKERM